MRLDRFFLPRIVIQCIQAVKDNIDAVVTDKQYAAYKKARRKHVPHALKKIKQKNYDKKMQLIQVHIMQI